MRTVFGVDPGANGAVAWDGGGGFVEVFKFAKSSRRELFEWLVERVTRESVAYVERVSASPQMGVVSAFTFGRNFERPLMALEAAGVEPIEIGPKEWQKALRIAFAKGLTYRERKAILKTEAERLFPDLRVTLATADALLICEFGRRLQDVE